MTAQCFSKWAKVIKFSGRRTELIGGARARRKAALPHMPDARWQMREPHIFE
jgi:hypothetical protein